MLLLPDYINYTYVPKCSLLGSFLDKNNEDFFWTCELEWLLTAGDEDADLTFDDMPFKEK